MRVSRLNDSEYVQDAWCNACAVYPARYAFVWPDSIPGAYGGLGTTLLCQVCASAAYDDARPSLIVTADLGAGTFLIPIAVERRTPPERFVLRLPDFDE